MTVTAMLLALWSPSKLEADLKVTANVEDLRLADRRLYLRYEFTGEKLLRGDQLTSVEVFITAKESTKDESWTLVFENEEVLRKAVEICCHNPVGTKVHIHGREIRMLRNRGFVVDLIESHW